MQLNGYHLNITNKTIKGHYIQHESLVRKNQELEPIRLFITYQKITIWLRKFGFTTVFTK